MSHAKECNPRFYWVRCGPGRWRVAEYRIDAAGARLWMVTGVRTAFGGGVTGSGSRTREHSPTQTRSIHTEGGLRNSTYRRSPHRVIGGHNGRIQVDFSPEPTVNFQYVVAPSLDRYAPAVCQCRLLRSVDSWGVQRHARIVFRRGPQSASARTRCSDPGGDEIAGHWTDVGDNHASCARCDPAMRCFSSIFLTSCTRRCSPAATFLRLSRRSLVASSLCSP